MEPLQPTVHQGVTQLKDFITKLVDIEEKEGKHSCLCLPRPLSYGPTYLCASLATPSLLSNHICPIALPVLVCDFGSLAHSLLWMFASSWTPPSPPCSPLALPPWLGRAGPAEGAEFAGTSSEGGATLHPQDQGQEPPLVLLF